jgi:hypothetical protein
VLELVSSARTAFTGISEVSTMSIDCRTPLSRSSKSAAVNPAAGFRPSVTSTSTRTPRARDEKACF